MSETGPQIPSACLSRLRTLVSCKITLLCSVGAPRNLARGAIRTSGDERISLTRKGLSRLAIVSQEIKDVSAYFHPSIMTNLTTVEDVLSFLPWFYINPTDILNINQVTKKKKEKKEKSQLNLIIQLLGLSDSLKIVKFYTHHL